MVELNEAFAAQALGRAARSSACPTTPSTSTPTAAPSPSATRSGCQRRPARPDRRARTARPRRPPRPGHHVHRRRPGYRPADGGGVMTNSNGPATPAVGGSTGGGAPRESAYDHFETLLTEVTDGVLLVTFNRPEVRNAINRQVQLDLRAALDTARADEAVGAVVLTGAGEKAFIAGADISQVAGYTKLTSLDSDLQRLFDLVEDFPNTTPRSTASRSAAAVRSPWRATSGSPRRRRDSGHFPETALAVLPGAGGTQRLGRLVGTGRAIELILHRAARWRGRGRADRARHRRDRAGRAHRQGTRDRRDDPRPRPARHPTRQARHPSRPGRRPAHRPGHRTPRPGRAVRERGQARGHGCLLGKRPPQFAGR